MRRTTSRAATRRNRPVRTYDLARLVAPQAGALRELYRRFVAEEERLAAALGADDASPTFDDFVTWIVDRGGRPPHRPRGVPEQPSAKARRMAAQRARRDREEVARQARPVAA